MRRRHLVVALVLMLPVAGATQAQEASAPTDTHTAEPTPATPEEQLRRPEELWFNRVDGAHVRMRFTDSAPFGLELAALAGYSFGLERWSYGGDVWRHWGSAHEWRLRLGHRRGTQVRYQSDNYGIDLNSLPALLGLADYFDYYWNERWRLELDRELAGGAVRLEGELRAERHSSLPKTTDFDLLDRVDAWRPNPAVDDGRLRSVAVLFVAGGPRVPFGTGAKRRLELGVEHSRRWLQGDYAFTLYHFRADYMLQTLGRGGTRPAVLDLRLVAGTFTGDLPVQRFGALDVRIWALTPYGGFRSVRDRPYEGDRHAAVYWSHNFHDTPLRAVGLRGAPFKSLGISVYGASGRTWVDATKRAQLAYEPRFPNAFHHEIGLALAVGEYVRLDLTRRLDQRHWNAGFSVAWFEFGL